MRIIKVVTGADGGGVFTSERAFSLEIRKQGNTVDGVIIGDGPSAPIYENMFSSVISVVRDFPQFDGSFSRKLVRFPESILKSSVIARDLGRSLEVIPSETIIAVRKPILLPLAGKLAKSLGVPVVWHIPEILSRFPKRPIFKYYCRKYDVLPIGNSQYTNQQMGFDDAPVVYPTFDPDSILKGGRCLRGKLSIPRGVPVFGLAARLAYEKAPDLVVKAFVQSLAFKDGAHLLIAGGPLCSALGQTIRSIIDKEGKGQIHLLGLQRNMANFYRTIDVLVNGRRNAEPFGISIIEALASGKPVIAYRLGGPSQTIKDGITGWHVEEPSVAGYLEGFERAHSMIGSWSSMAKKCVESVVTYGVENQVSSYLKYVREVLDRRH